MKKANCPFDISPEQVIRDLARKHDIVATRTETDELADAITALAGDTVVRDEIEDLVVTMRRQGVISSEQATALYGDYLANLERP
ncbi:hypothetical protein [Mesorhizobium sp. SP-1A]|uniref:hypothetical protein n=1 Tax=Mesorhizobium sp. SP-1A TaxID=3077840 RepID=UPI0028F705C5|nr:hypothetical protein [Mesorhizobium sp. SP-1A]